MRGLSWRRRPVPMAVRIDRARRVGGLSLMLAIAIGFLWARSAVYFDVFTAATGDAHLQAVTSDRGVVSVFMSTVPTAPDRAWSIDHHAARGESMDATLAEVAKEIEWQGGAASFKIGRSRPDAFGINGKAWFVFARFPHWLPILVVLMPSIWRWRWAWMASRRQRRGLCFQCGYDLRESIGRCPECGAGIEMRQAVT